MLTDTQIRNLKPTNKVYRIADQGGLCIEVRPSGGKFWRYRFRFDQKPKMQALGSYPSTSLAEARRKHEASVKILEKGINPITYAAELKEKAAAERRNLFYYYAESFLKKMKSKGKSSGYIRQIKTNQDKHILPAIGDKPIRDIDTMDITQMMHDTAKRVKDTKRYGTGEVTAEICRQQVSMVFRHAMRTNRGLQDPTIAAKGEIERPPINHARDLARDELIEMLNAVARYGGVVSTKGVIWTMLYTITRTKEARHMRWAHIDIERKVWTIPLAEISKRRQGERNMKSDRPHIIPLSDQMMTIINYMKPVSGGGEFVFPSPKNPKNPLSSSTVNSALKYMGLDDVSGHDTRATCSTYLHGMGFNTDHIEFQMAHIDGSVRGVYNYAKWLPERRSMLQVWADYLDALVSDKPKDEDIVQNAKILCTQPTLSIKSNKYEWRNINKKEYVSVQDLNGAGAIDDFVKELEACYNIKLTEVEALDVFRSAGTEKLMTTLLDKTLAKDGKKNYQLIKNSPAYDAIVNALYVLRGKNALNMGFKGCKDLSKGDTDEAMTDLYITPIQLETN
ncbi:tyrosine-type recombinase/integrase [Psychrobacter pygoscelis]|uniref:tyrosine-type recombinase/integrase n=1 Tax=Psychrobacter pygoscelis TaxID=2488563 RepID=UPI00103BFD3E|nr:integrase arm-type DNA-binding domain-containing protein [Psychrobacter pygoscelis]